MYGKKKKFQAGKGSPNKGISDAIKAVKKSQEAATQRDTDTRAKQSAVRRKLDDLSKAPLTKKRGVQKLSGPKEGPKSPKPTPSEVKGSLKIPTKKLTYAEAKKKDPKLDSYIKKRNALKAAGETGSAEYKAVQNKINAAFGVSKQRVERASTPMSKMASKGLSTSKPEAKLQTPRSKPKSSSSGSSKSSSSSTSKSSKKTGAEVKDKSVSRALADIGIEPSKEVSFNSPSRKDKRKARRKAVREVRKSMR